ncbi:MAG: arylsulfatase A-like enzyme [Halioglobus sp.]|jgi:arylsulfatase A-like enzyme
MSLLAAALVAAPVSWAANKPNILIIWGDAIGPVNISAYNNGIMGDRSCPAGRADFITGRHPRRTGLSKVGLPDALEGMRKEDPTIAGLLKPHGYMTGQFGKNHLGDLDEHLPTNHGFDKFFGNLYHLNAKEEPEHVDYPLSDEFAKQFGPRGVIHSYADGNIGTLETGSIADLVIVDGDPLKAIKVLQDHSKLCVIKGRQKFIP